MADQTTTTQKVKLDNLYDVMFASPTQAKPQSNLDKHVRVGADGKMNVLPNHFSISDLPEDAEPVLDLTKVKVSKTFKLVSSLPKLKTVPATPQFFDMAGSFVTYPDAQVEAKKYEISTGLFSAIGGFFGGQ